MFRTIIVGYDGSQQADDALDLAQELREPDGGRLIVATVVPLAPGVLLTAPDAHVQDARERAELELARAGARLGADTSYELVPVGDTSAARGLHRLAEERQADLVVLGSTHLQGAAVFMGRATVQRLLHGAPCPVAVAAAGRRRDGVARICVAYDGSAEARIALDTAYSIARGSGGTVAILRVADVAVRTYGVAPAMLSAEAMELGTVRAQQELDATVAEAPADIPTEEHVLQGAVVPALLAESHDADLLIAGSRSYGPLHRVLVGSVSIGLLTDGRIPVLIVPRAHDRADAEIRSRTAAAAAA